VAKEEKVKEQKDLAKTKETRAKETKAITRQEAGFFQNIGKKIRQFFRETVGELKKVTWPTRKEAINLTGIVLVVIFSVGIYLGLWDFIFTKVFAWIFSTLPSLFA
jgi:preprotein translocase subunit SecE